MVFQLVRKEHLNEARVVNPMRVDALTCYEFFEAANALLAGKEDLRHSHGQYTHSLDT